MLKMRKEGRKKGKTNEGPVAFAICCELKRNAFTIRSQSAAAATYYAK
jgi:hypothetical protein